MIKVDTREAALELEKLKNKLSEKQVATATRMALNEGIRKAKTEVRRTIQSMYNIKPSRLNNTDKKKGLSIKLATGNNLSAEVDAGHTPLSLSEADPKFKGDAVATQVKFNKNGKASKGKQFKRSTGKISVEILKGERKILETAFTIATATHGGSGMQFNTGAIFARGKKGKPGFVFGKSRLPIDSMSTVSVATAALNTKAQSMTEPIVNEFVNNRMEHHLKRMLE